VVVTRKVHGEGILKHFHIHKAKILSTPMALYFKLGSRQTPSSDKEKKAMQLAPYTSTVTSFMYAMVCTRPNITHVVGVFFPILI